MAKYLVLIALAAVAIAGTALVGMTFAVRWEYLWFPAVTLASCLFLGANRLSLVMRRIHPIDCCGWRVDEDGKRLPPHLQPLRMKNWLAIVLGVAASAFATLTVYMAVLMRQQIWEARMLGAMMYAMSGAGLGGMLSGWLAGLLDWHTGEPEHDNPIMVSAMSLMASMMGAMPSSMLGGMMALMGWRAIAPTVGTGAAMFLGYYLFLFRGKFRVTLTRMDAERAWHPTPLAPSFTEQDSLQPTQTLPRPLLANASSHEHASMFSQSEFSLEPRINLPDMDFDRDDNKNLDNPSP